MNFRHFLFLLSLISLLVLGCAQRETDIGSNAITGTTENKFAILSGHPTHSTDWHPPFTNGYGTSLEIGDAKNLFAFTAIRFDATTGLPDSVRVDSMEIRLYRGKVWPTTGFPGLQVRIREIPNSVIWTQGTLIPGSLPGRESYPILDSVLASATDTFLTIPIKNPQEMWHKWHADSGKGLVIEPRSDQPGGHGGFIEFYSHEIPSGVHPEYAPALIIHGSARVNDSTFSPDTTVTAGALHDAYLVIDSTDINEPDAHHEHLLVTQGMAQRAALYFPLDTVVTNFSRAVSRAELHMFADTTSPLMIRYTGENVLLKHGFLNDTTWVAHPDSLQLNSELGPEASTNGTWDVTSSEFILDVTGAVATWISNPARNGGLQFFASDELNTLEREVFFGADAVDVNKRPKLYIWYTEISH
ncbi:MAG TPA: hypothetical protein VGL38_01925 [bacterium]